MVLDVFSWVQPVCLDSSQVQSVSASPARSRSPRSFRRGRCGEVNGWRAHSRRRRESEKKRNEKKWNEEKWFEMFCFVLFCLFRFSSCLFSKAFPLWGDVSHAGPPRAADAAPGGRRRGRVQAPHELPRVSQVRPGPGQKKRDVKTSKKLLNT